MYFDPVSGYFSQNGILPTASPRVLVDRKSVTRSVAVVHALLPHLPVHSVGRGNAGYPSGPRLGPEPAPNAPVLVVGSDSLSDAPYSPFARWTLQVLQIHYRDPGSNWSYASRRVPPPLIELPGLTPRDATRPAPVLPGRHGEPHWQHWQTDPNPWLRSHGVRVPRALAILAEQMGYPPLTPGVSAWWPAPAGELYTAARSMRLSAILTQHPPMELAAMLTTPARRWLWVWCDALHPLRQLTTTSNQWWHPGWGYVPLHQDNYDAHVRCGLSDAYRRLADHWRIGPGPDPLDPATPAMGPGAAALPPAPDAAPWASRPATAATVSTSSLEDIL